MICKLLWINMIHVDFCDWLYVFLSLFFNAMGIYNRLGQILIENKK